MIDTVVPMPTRLQRLGAFCGLLGYLLTQAQVDAHRKQRAQLLAARPMPGPADVTKLDDFGCPDEHYREGDLHDATPHIHRTVAGADVWPHTHDG